LAHPFGGGAALVGASRLGDHQAGAAAERQVQRLA
jgi:hypothetical protein